MAKPKNASWDFPIPLIYPRTYLAIAEEHGLQGKELMRQAGLKVRDLSDAQQSFSMVEMDRLLQVIVAALGDIGIGFEVGWRLPPTAYGSFGYALLCSSTVEEALKICLRYWHLIGKGLAVTADIQDKICVIDFVPQIPISSEIDRRIMVEAALSSFYRGFQLILGNSDIHGELWFDFAEPPYSEQLRARIPNVKYEMPGNQLRFDKALLSLHLPMANPTGLQFAVMQCEKEEALSGLESSRLLARAQNAMVLGVKGYPSLEELSKMLNMTPRTLRRKLQLEGSKYSQLLEESRRRDAVKLLDNRNLEVQKVAELLGYADPANFTRAFRQWTGQTPSEYRVTRNN